MTSWSFLTSHARALLCIAHEPGVRLRDIAGRARPGQAGHPHARQVDGLLAGYLLDRGLHPGAVWDVAAYGQPLGPGRMGRLWLLRLALPVLLGTAAVSGVHSGGDADHVGACGSEAREREVLAAMLEVEADVAAWHDGILLISDKGFAGRDFEQLLAGYSITLLQPSRADEQARYGEPMLKKVRQLIESVNDTLKGQLSLEGHGGRSCAGVTIRVAQRILAMAAAIWRNNQTGSAVTRSLIAYDHCAIRTYSSSSARCRSGRLRVALDPPPR